MKLQCSECGSDKIIPSVWVVDHSPHTSDGMVHDNSLRVRIDGDPQAWILKETLYGELSADICGNCGRTNLYARNPRELYAKYLAARTRR